MSQTIPNAAGSESADLLLAEARAFMAAYAEDLRRGDRAALAARYDSAGAYELRPGSVRHTSHEALTARYATAWQPPAMFEWRDLAYEVVGPDAVIVTGLFAWTTAEGKPPLLESYAALLRRQADGGLRIGLEAEAGKPPIPWAMLGMGATVLVGFGMTVGWLAGRRVNGRGDR